MTETEKAIAFFERCGVPYADTAAKALRSQQEREKGIPVKAGGKNPDGGSRYFCPKCGRVFWDADSVEDYCPSCGMKLKEAQEDEK